MIQNNDVTNFIYLVPSLLLQEKAAVKLQPRASDINRSYLIETLKKGLPVSNRDLDTYHRRRLASVMAYIKSAGMEVETLNMKTLELERYSLYKLKNP